MNGRIARAWRFLLFITIALAADLRAEAQGQPAAPGPSDAMPMLRLEPGGPTSFVSGLAFNPAGTTLYAGGWDKVVRSWRWDAKSGQFELDAAATYRVPIGPGLDGVINAVALSPDGVWLAAAGRGLVRGASDLRHPGWKVPAAGAMTAAMRLDQGTIYLFNTRTGDVRQLRGHTAPVVALCFAPAQSGKSTVLVSAGQEWDDAKRQFSGAVRAWEAERGSYISGVMLSDVATRPGLAAWHTGAEAKQLRVAIAWGDTSQTLRVWDLQTGALRTARDGQFNNTVAWVPQTGGLITGTTGRLKFWNTRGAGGTPVMEREVPLGAVEVPRAIALFSSDGSGQLDRAAVVVKSGEGDEQVSLRVFDLTRGQLLPGSVRLFPGAGVIPALAAAPGGAELAIAGNPRGTIDTLAIGDVLAGRAEPKSIASAGLAPRSVGFVKRGDTLGVWISPRGKPAAGAPALAPAAGDVVFDPATRSVAEINGDWQPAGLQTGDWNLQVGGGAPDSPARIDVRQGDRLVRQITLPAGRLATDCVIAPPNTSRSVPIAVVATQQLGQPLLEIYDLQTGASVRELTGHVAAISGLALSEDGALLASAAGDRTVSIWNLEDLGSVIGRRGSLRGVALEQTNAGLRVVEIAADSPYRAGSLAVGDTLVNWFRDGRMEPIGSLVDFYLTVSRVKPGETISLRRQRAGQGLQTVPLQVSQGTDERKPLFTLFVAPEEQTRGWNWIGWSPLGPYESSGEAMEQSLGWHFNTGLANAPVRFAQAAEYRDLRQEGVLEHLLRERALPAEKPQPLDRPSVSMWLKQPGHEDQIVNGQSVTRLIGRQAELQLEVRGLTPDQIASVTAQAKGAEPAPLAPVGQQSWQATLVNLPAERTTFPLRIAIVTSEAEPQTFVEEAQLIYQPLPPAIEIAGLNDMTQVVREEEVRLTGSVTSRETPPGRINLSVIYRVRDKQMLVRKFADQGTLRFDELMKLEPGDVAISLVATNADAREDSEAERTIVVRRFFYNPRPVAPPLVRIEAVAPGKERRQLLTSDQDEPLVVDAPTLRLEGRAAAETPLTMAEWIVKGDSRPADHFKPDAAPQFELAQEITLTPGVQRIAVRAQAQRSLPAEASLRVTYQPRLPEPVLTSPAEGTKLIEGRDRPRVKLAAHLDPVEDRHPFQAQVLINGQPHGEPIALDAAADSFSTQIELPSGESRLALRLTNEWGAAKVSTAALVHYLRPPRVVEVSAPAKSDSPLVDVSFVIEAPTALGLSGLQVNGWELPVRSATVERETPEMTRWKVTAQKIPLREGANEIRPLARNRDGWSLDGQTARVEVMLPPPPKPEIEYLSPHADRTMESREAQVVVAVRSESRLERVEVRRGERRLAEIDVAAQAEEPSAQGGRPKFRLVFSTPVALEARDNRLEVIAVNEGGQSSAPLTLTYVPKPVEILIDGLADARGELLTPQLREGGRTTFTQAAGEGNLWLQGRVRWPDAASQQLHRVSQLHLWVNGFLQVPVRLQAPAAPGLEWTWKAKVRLNRREGNQISVRLPTEVLAATNRLDFQVNCSAPDERQRLHLLVVGVGEKNTAELESLALGAIQGRRTRGDQITTPAFEQGWVYLISGYVNRGRVAAQLDRIHLRVGDKAEAGNDVVMVYYRGQETLDDRGRFYLLTSQSQFDRDLLASSISGSELSERFRSIPGAQVFLLDVQRKLPEQIVQSPPAIDWPRDPQMAALRYVWLSEDQAPPDAQLLAAFDSALPRAGRLGELESELSRLAQPVVQKYGPALRYEPRVPEALRDLVLARPGAVGE